MPTTLIFKDPNVAKHTCYLHEMYVVVPAYMTPNLAISFVFNSHDIDYLMRN